MKCLNELSLKLVTGRSAPESSRQEHLGQWPDPGDLAADLKNIGLTPADVAPRPMRRVQRTLSVPFVADEIECSICGHNADCHRSGPCDGVVPIPDGSQRPCDCKGLQ